jgi:hypothetical protein
MCELPPGGAGCCPAQSAATCSPGNARGWLGDGEHRPFGSPDVTEAITDASATRRLAMRGWVVLGWVT